MKMPDLSSFHLTPVNHSFLQRVYSGGIGRYRERLKGMGFQGLDHVLDLGCGFGQWAMALSGLNRQVTAVDADPTRICVCQRIAECNGVNNIRFVVRRMESFPEPERTYDGAFCYSTIYHGDEGMTLSGLRRSLRESGIVYLNFNGIGWFFHYCVSRGLLRGDSEALTKGGLALLRTLIGSKKGAHALSPARVKKLLMEKGFEILNEGPDGSLTNSSIPSVPFFRGSYYGMSGVWDILARVGKSS